MLYQVIHLQTYVLKTLLAKDILDMDYDADGRIIVTDTDQQSYFLLANKDLVESEK